MTLRPIGQQDVEAIQNYASDSRLSTTCNVPYPYPGGGAEAFVNLVAARRESCESYAFAILQDGVFAGVMSLNAVNRVERKAALDYWVALPFWNKGIGTAAAAEAVQYAFGVLVLDWLESGCLARNPGSARVLEKNGFVETGTTVYQGEPGHKFSGERIRLFTKRRELM